jgi:transcriptional regulator with XRE-family HTH domain
VTPGQSRAARALLKITQADLARLAGVGLSTVVDFERERRNVSEQAAAGMRAALEEAGIEFIPANGGGPGVRLNRDTK